MRIEANGSPVPHPDDPAWMVAPHEVKVFQPDGTLHPCVVGVDTDAHLVFVHPVGLDGEVVLQGDRPRVDTLDVSRGGWELEFPDGTRVRV